jgi:hypothetical protein
MIKLRFMSKSTLLAKLKGSRRTFVVHSSTSPYAAVAAMGVAMGRSRELGSYFHFSTELIPVVQLDDSADSGVSNLKIDFQGDWARFIRQKGAPACGLKLDESRTLEENTMRYLNARRRIPTPRPRKVHESRELFVPQEDRQDYLALKSLITSGADLKPYLSKDILRKKRPGKNDRALNSLGIQHFRLEETWPENILLCKITDADVFVIQALPHERHVWVDTQLLQILHNNWPEEIAAGKVHGVPGEVRTSVERLTLRDLNANFVTTMADSTDYLAPGGGLMASGECSEDRISCDKIFGELAYWLGIVESNATRVRAALNLPSSQGLSIRMMFEDRECCLYEPTTGKRIDLKTSDEQTPFPVIKPRTSGGVF